MSSLDRVASIDDLRGLARRRLPRLCFDWLDGGANGEVTLRANRAAFDACVLRPRHLVDVSCRDQSTVVCGTATTMPVLLAPAGLASIVRSGAETAVARAAGRAGTAYCLSAGSSVALEDVARAATGPLWFQLYLWRGREVYESLARRAGRNGFDVLVVTVDAPVSGRRERDIHNAFTLPIRLSARERIRTALRHPGWTWDARRGGPITFANLADAGRADGGQALAETMERLHDPSATWENLARLRDVWPGKLLVKGVLTAEDASRAIACGADGVIVSNHGGRQLDSAPATLDVLPEVAAAVGGRADVLLDSGVRRGSDVVKAIALGATAVLVGRPYLYGLAAAGEAGVDHALELLRQEIDICLGLVGRPSLAELDATAVGPARRAVAHPE